MTNEQFEAIKTIKLEKLGLLLIEYFAYILRSFHYLRKFEILSEKNIMSLILS